MQDGKRFTPGKKALPSNRGGDDKERSRNRVGGSGDRWHIWQGISQILRLSVFVSQEDGLGSGGAAEGVGFIALDRESGRNAIRYGKRNS